MLSLIRLELKKIFSIKLLISSIAILMLLMQEIFPMLIDGNAQHLDSVYAFIVSCDLGLIGLLAASLCVIPYGFQFCDEIQGHYYRFILTRKSKKQYVASRFISSIFASAISMLLPLLIFIAIICSLFPRLEFGRDLGLSSTMWGNVLKQFGDIGFFTSQLLVAGFYAFTMGAISAVAATLTHDKYATIAAPFIISYFSIYLSQRIGVAFMDFSFGFLPTHVSVGVYLSVFFYSLIIIILSAVLFWIKTDRSIENG